MNREGELEQKDWSPGQRQATGLVSMETSVRAFAANQLQCPYNDYNRLIQSGHCFS